MKKLKIILLISIIFLVILAGKANAYNYTMSWDFSILNNPSARQVAINTAEKQAGLIEEEEDPMEAFVNSLERRLISTVQGDIIDQILDEDEVAFGQYDVGDLSITVAEDPDTGEVVVEIENVITGEKTVITYSSEDWYGW